MEPTIRDIQRVELHILQEVRRVCEEHGIGYFLDAGTLLGAARHQGFIPWDDDVDLGMLRADYDRFCAIAPSALSPRFFLQTPATDPASLVPFAKVRMNGTRYVGVGLEGRPMHQGFSIDIFPYDTVADGATFQRACRACRWRSRLYLLRFAPLEHPRTARQRIGCLAAQALRRLPERWFTAPLSALAARFADDEGEVVTCLQYLAEPPRYAIDDVLPFGELPFEGQPYPVMAQWERCLEALYGDWRQLPPEDERTWHRAVEVQLPADLEGDGAPQAA